jgi:acetyl/propionyl-CoA carboxylase alpha subunit
MTKKDFVENWTEERADILQELAKALELCKVYGIQPKTEYTQTDMTTPVGQWIIDTPYTELNASQLEVLCVEVADQLEKLTAYHNLLSALTTAQNELESVDLYEFDEE